MRVGNKGRRATELPERRERERRDGRRRGEGKGIDRVQLVLINNQVNQLSIKVNHGATLWVRIHRERRGAERSGMQKIIAE
jgi:hypothetical protein